MTALSINEIARLHSAARSAISAYLQSEMSSDEAENFAEEYIDDLDSLLDVRAQVRHNASLVSEARRVYAADVTT